MLKSTIRKLAAVIMIAPALALASLGTAASAATSAHPASTTQSTVTSTRSAGLAPAQSCGTAAGYLVNGNFNLGVHLAPHNGIDTVATYPGASVTHMGFLCVGVDSAGDSIWVIGGGGVCLDEGNASQQNLIFSEGCNDSLTTERWIALANGQLENNHFGNCLSSGNANGATLGGRSCSPSPLNEWFVAATN